MRHDPRIKKKLVLRIKEAKQTYIEIFNEYIKELNLARSVEGIMKAKQRFLVDLSCALPTDSTDCYFCVLLKTNCRGCKYAEHHGTCIDNISSDFAKLRLVKQGLINVLRNDYYRGEKYSETK